MQRQRSRGGGGGGRRPTRGGELGGREGGGREGSSIADRLLARRLLLLRPGADDRQLEATASLSRDAVRDDAPGGHVDGRSRASIEGTKPFDPLGWLLRAGAAPVVEAHRRRARRRRLGHRRGA